ncbi:MAG: hypothetical protein AMXMBFR6_17520 [Betaproteobacteria bacterium]
MVPACEWQADVAPGTAIVLRLRESGARRWGAVIVAARSKANAPMPQLSDAEVLELRGAGRGHDQAIPRNGMGAVQGVGVQEWSFVVTMAIAAPQQGHWIAGRGLRVVLAGGPGLNRSSKCNSAIRRLQFGCRNRVQEPEVPGTAKVLGQDMLQDEPPQASPWC